MSTVGSWNLLEVAHELVRVFRTSILGPGRIVFRTLASSFRPSKEREGSGGKRKEEDEEEKDAEEEEEEEEGEERKW